MGEPVRAVVAAEHPLLRGVIEAACREVDVAVVSAVDTAAATLAACRSSRPDLLILDLDLPDADGLGVLAELGDGDRPGAVLVLSDHADGEVVLRSLRLGARGYVTKAEGLRDLAETLRRVVAGERAIAPALEQDAVLALGRFVRRAREGAEVAAVLTAREQQVLELLSDGRTMRQIATRLGISPRTVETHVAKLYRKLGVRTRVQAVSRAATLGLVEL
ncbi:MAG TPA: response regulator transcription factor [Actinomycetota bacterium]|nr:response regulator transcription factor [Actinomycetota bacterium]